MFCFYKYSRNVYISLQPTVSSFQCIILSDYVIFIMSGRSLSKMLSPLIDIALASVVLFFMKLCYVIAQRFSQNSKKTER